MKTVNEVFEIIEKVARPLPPQVFPILECLDLVAAENLYAPIDVPVFDNSAMDGYAFGFRDFQNNIPLKINYTIEAGSPETIVLKEGEAARIFTGAPIPQGADTVVQQEICVADNGILTFSDEIKPGTHIRKQGSQTQKGSCILEKGNLLTAEFIGFLATFGVLEIKVSPKPKVGILITGKELVPAGKPLKTGQIYESNSIALRAILKTMSVEVLFNKWIDDNPNELLAFIRNEAPKVDVLILTGGISVGDFDFVKPVLDQLNTKEFCYKVKQKPGKPLYFGELGQTFVWALPGNPGSVMTCFHVFVKPFLKAIGGQNPFDKKHYGILTNPFHKKPGITQFVKALMENQKIKILDSQLSYQMNSYPQANGYALLKEGLENFQIGEKVEFIYFGNAH